jgi:FkbM family methyltransferase
MRPVGLIRNRIRVASAHWDPYAKVRRLLSPPERRVRLLSWLGIDLVLDVGANEGQYASRLRDAGFEGRILSFEPGSEAYGRLEEHASDDPKWHCRQLALGADGGTTVLNVAEDSEGSSLLRVLPREVANSPGSRYVGRESVAVARLDSIWSDVVPSGRQAHLKLDTQGTELAILHGAEKALAHLPLVEIELSLVRLYEGGALFDQVLEFMRGHDFELIGLEGVDEERDTGQMLQVDGIFRRR